MRGVFKGIFLLPVVLLLLGGCSDASQSGAEDNQAPAEAGEQTYNRFCFSCHASGVAGAPRTGDKVAWATKIEKGDKKMLELVIQGVPPGMPPRGMCMQCSDAELADALQYILERSR